MSSHTDFNIQYAKEVDVTPQMMEGQDLCITIGGDNTFLRTAGSIINPMRTAILGVNSQPKVQNGKLTEMSVDLEKHED